MKRGIPPSRIFCSLLAGCLLFLVFSGCAHQGQTAPAPAAAKGINPSGQDGVFIHLSHGADAPQRVSMALSLADTYADSHPVLLYFDIRGIDVVVRDGPDIEHKAFRSTQSLLDSLRGRGVILMACPSCLKAAGHAPEDLIEGVQTADKERFLNFASGRILTVDY